jgi:hypothetical protein
MGISLINSIINFKNYGTLTLITTFFILLLPGTLMAGRCISCGEKIKKVLRAIAYFPRFMFR